jgi:hypothetical protein
MRRRTFPARPTGNPGTKPNSSPNLGGSDPIADLWILISGSDLWILSSGGERDRTDDLLLAKQALSQLSYTPVSGAGNQASGTRTNLPEAWRLVPGP